MSDSTDVVSYNNKQKERKRITRSFGWNVFATFCCWSAYTSIFNLQSSINVEDGLGTNTFAVGYSVSAILSIVIAPTMMKKFGAKKCLIISDCSIFLFIVANLYPRYYTLLPACVLMLLLQCTGFPSMSMLNVLYAHLYSAITNKSKEHYTIRFSGYFFTGFQCCQIFGNMLSYVVLYGFEQSVSTEQEFSANCSSITPENSTFCEPDQEGFQYCGVNDCQNATVVEKYINQYKPISQIPLYILIGILLFLEISAVIIHALAVPSDQTFIRKTTYYKEEKLLMEDSNATVRDSTQSPQVGICMVLFGVFDAIFSWFVGKFGRRIGRIGLFVLTLCGESVNYMYCYFWLPNSNNLISICAVFCMFGLTDGILQTIINVTHIDLFPEKREIVLSVWNLINSLGFATGMMLSQLMCVRQRIFFNLGLIITGTACLIVADIRHRQMLNKKDKAPNEPSVTTG